MITAAWVAYGLWQKKVVVNYQASDMLLWDVFVKNKRMSVYPKDPMPELELAKSRFDFSKMQKNLESNMKNEKYFPPRIEFIDQ